MFKGSERGSDVRVYIEKTKVKDANAKRGTKRR